MPKKPEEVTVDFTGVESGGGGGGDYFPEGDYAFKIQSTKLSKGESSGTPYIQVNAVVSQGPKKGKKAKPVRLSLSKKALWKLRSLLEACGKKVPSKSIKINITKMVGWEFAGTVADDEYEGKKSSEIVSFFPIDELGKATGADALEDAGDDVDNVEPEDAEESSEEGEAEELFS